MGLGHIERSSRFHRGINETVHTQLAIVRYTYAYTLRLKVHLRVKMSYINFARFYRLDLIA